MPLTSSPPIDLASIQSEFSASSLSGAGLAYFGRANCNMLEFLGAASATYNFESFQASTTGYLQFGEAYIAYSSAGTVLVYYDLGGGGEQLTPSQGYPYGTGRHTWLVSGSGAGVEGYVTRIVTPTQYMNEPTLNTWIPIGSIGFGAAGYGGSNEYGAWYVAFRDSRGRSLGTVSHSVQLYIYEPVGNFGTSPYFSDIRLKENIQKIGQIDGLNIYTFNYLNSDELQTGVMAQELLGTKYESAVRVHNSGFYQVDYNKIPTIKNFS
jgi:hypothetical protein